MQEIFIQLVVAVLAVVASGLKSLRFAPSELTDFELNRRVLANNAAAKRELHLRQMRPLLDALRRLIVLLLTIIIVIILAGTHNFVIAILLALAWLLIVELLSARHWLNEFAEKLAAQYQHYIMRAVDTMRPALQLLADVQVLGKGSSAVFYSKPELLQAVDNDTSVLNKDEKLLIHQALAYKDMIVSDIMTPRSVVTTVGAKDTIGPVLLDRLHQSGHSRFPVIHGDLDHVKGVLYMHELVPLNPKLKDVSDVMDRKVFFVQQDRPLDHVLQAFLRTKHHLFMTVNEFEEVTGVISIEDVLETIIGRKIVGEFDRYEDLRAVAKLAASELRKARSN
jgi:CBS domain containing-hemolysin-like protein